MTTNPQGRYAEVDGLSIYYEVHGEGFPLVLLHGGLLTIELNFGDVLPDLATTHRIVAIELQGHGRTADTDRPITLERLADDVAAVLDHARVDQADVLGFSLGGMVAVEVARRHPDRVRRLVLASITGRPEGFHADVHGPNAQLGVGRMPTKADFEAMQQAHQAVAPRPEDFGTITAKLSAYVGSHPGWSDDELGEVGAPTLLLVGDRDFILVSEADRMGEVMTDAHLAVVPYATHMSLLPERDLVLPILRRFLDA